MCWRRACTHMLTRVSVVRNSVSVMLSPWVQRVADGSWWGVCFSQGYRPPKDAGRGEPVNLWVLSCWIFWMQIFFLIYSLIKPSWHWVFFVNHVYEIWVSDDMSLSYSSERKASQKSDRWFCGKLGQACCSRLLSSFQWNQDIFRVSSKVDFFFSVRKWSQRPVLFFHRHSDRLNCQSKDLTLSHHLEDEASAVVSGSLCRWFVVFSYLKHLKVLPESGSVSWKKVPLPKCKDTCLVPPSNSCHQRWCHGPLMVLLWWKYLSNYEAKEMVNYPHILHISWAFHWKKSTVGISPWGREYTLYTLKPFFLVF